MPEKISQTILLTSAKWSVGIAECKYGVAVWLILFIFNQSSGQTVPVKS
jgi:hypothetical protein